MALLERIQKDMTEAMKARQEERLSALRLIKTALKKHEIDAMKPLDEKTELQVLNTLIKQRREAAEQFEHAGRHEMAAKETAEVPILEEYQVAKADPAAIEAAVDRAISETAATSAKDIGKVMKAAMAILAGQTVDGRAVNELVRRKLTR